MNKKIPQSKRTKRSLNAEKTKEKFIKENFWASLYVKREVSELSELEHTHEYDITYSYATFNKKDIFSDWVVVQIRSFEKFEQLKTCSKLYLAVMVYDSIDTFGSYEGCKDILDVFSTEKEAKAFFSSYKEPDWWGTSINN